MWMAALIALAMGMGAARAAPLLIDRPSYDASALQSASAVLVDDSRALSLADVRRLDAEGRFQPLAQLFGAGYAHGAYWLRLELRRGEDTPADWWLQVGPAYLDEVRMTLVRPNGEALPTLQDGDRVARFNTVHRMPTFPLHLAPGVNTVYLRVQSTSSISILPSLVSMDHAATHWQAEYMLVGLYTGLEVALVVAAALGAVMLRRGVYVYFALFIAAGVLQRFALGGMAHQWWFPNNPLLADSMASCLVGIAAALGAFFFAELFEYRRHHRWLFWIIRLSGIYMILTALAPLFGVFHRLIQVAVVLMLLNFLLMSVPLVRQWRTGNLAMRLGVIGFVGYMGMVLINVVSLLGLIPPSPEILSAAQPASLVLLFMLLLVILLQKKRAQRDRQVAMDAAEQARAAEERERQAREEQSHLTSMIAHEIRTPVAVIDAALQSLQVLDEHPTPERLLRHQRIGRAVQRMNTLMELALTQDRLEVSEWTQRLAAVDLAALTKDVLANHGPMAESRVTLHPGSGLCTVQADERMLRFALLNLVDNALKYSPRNAQVEISIEPLERDGVAGCVWRIDDRGPGIPEVDRERVFQKYFRAAETTGTPGLGLGLYIVRQIVQQHGGQVAALLRPTGMGTRFECWLPTEPPKESDS